jgi:hypothetical protein
MAFKKRGTSPELEKAQNRLEGIKQFEDPLNYGQGLTEADYTEKIDLVDSLTKEYNGLLTQADGIGTRLDLAEKSLAEISQRFLNSVGAKYGYNSVEYEKAGGIRKSDYKRPAKKNGSATSAA